MAPLFDASAVGTPSGFVTGGVVTITPWNISVGVGADFGIIAAVISNGGAAAFNPTSATVTMGGVTLTPLTPLPTTTFMSANIGAGTICVWVGSGIPSGTQSCTMVLNCSGQNVSNVVPVATTLSGVGSYGTLQLAQGQFNPNAVTVPSAVGRLVWCCIGNYQTGAYTSGSPTFTQRVNYITGGGPYFTTGDMAGVASTGVSITQGSTFGWEAVGLELLPAAPQLIRPSLKVTQAINRSSRY